MSDTALTVKQTLNEIQALWEKAYADEQGEICAKLEQLHQAISAERQQIVTDQLKLRQAYQALNKYQDELNAATARNAKLESELMDAYHDGMRDGIAQERARLEQHKPRHDDYPIHRLGSYGGSK